jgi:Flp pilus assembly protein TadD
MRGFLKLQLRLCACVCAFSAAAVSAQGSYSPYNESPSAALARYVRNLASDPKDFESLIGAGKSALEIGDAQAAAGFFARADEVNPRSPLPQAGMGAVSVANGEPQAAIPYFKRAQQLGGSVSDFACDRGLAYDLMGQQAQAQSDYRTALSGQDSDEARRRLALSLAISGNRAGALDMLAPLSAKGDTGVARVRAFVLALTGDSNAAMLAINAVMPGASANVAPFLQRLPGLSAGQKAAAVNLGIFPDSGETAYAYAAPTRILAQPTSPTSTGSVTTERLSSVDALLRNTPAPAPVQPAPMPAQPGFQPQAVQVAYVPTPPPVTVQRTAAVVQPKLWLQLASSQDVDDLATKFRRLKTKSPDLFDGIKPYVLKSADRARLLVGPFRGDSDATIFAEDLESLGVTASKFTNSESDRIAPLPVE